MKGRGFLRFTGRSRSRSLTPPHWRRAVEERVKMSAPGLGRSREEIFGGKLASDSIGADAASTAANGVVVAIEKTNGRHQHASESGDRKHQRRRDEENVEASATKKRSRSRSRETKRDRDRDRERDRHAKKRSESQDEEQSHHRHRNRSSR